jgi:hypothetical protein
VAIDRNGKWWKGGEGKDLKEYLIAFTAEGSGIDKFRLAKCDCGGKVFKVRADKNEGVAMRICIECGGEHLVGDGAEIWDEAKPRQIKCPCKANAFNVAVGFSIRKGMKDVRWIYVGLRCVQCGVLGCYVDWKIDYSPSMELISQA